MVKLRTDKLSVGGSFKENKVKIEGKDNADSCGIIYHSKSLIQVNLSTSRRKKGKG